MIRKAMRFKGVGIDQISAAIRVPVMTAASKLYGEQRFSLEEAFVLQACFFSEYTIAELFSERGDQVTKRFVKESRAQQDAELDPAEAERSEEERS